MKLGTIVSSEKVKLGIVNQKVDNNFLRGMLNEIKTGEEAPYLNLSEFDDMIEEGPVFQENNMIIYKLSAKKITQDKFDTRGRSSFDTEALGLIWDKEKYSFYVPDMYFVLIVNPYLSDIAIVAKKDIFLPLLNLFNSSPDIDDYGLDAHVGYRREMNDIALKYFDSLREEDNDIDGKDYYLFRTCTGQAYEYFPEVKRNGRLHADEAVNIFLSSPSNTDLIPNRFLYDWSSSERPETTELSIITIFKGLSYLSSVMEKEEMLDFLRELKKICHGREKKPIDLIVETVIEKKKDELDEEEIKKIKSLLDY